MTNQPNQPLKAWHKVVMTIWAILITTQLAFWFPSAAIIIASIIVGALIVVALAWLNEKSGGLLGVLFCINMMGD